MKTVLLMRHAEAGDTTSGLTDFDRCLTEDGADVARKTGQLLHTLQIKVDRIVCSSAVRTHETASLVASAACPEVPVIALDRLYNASADSFQSAIAQVMLEEEACALVVGHNPGMASLMCRWADQRLSVSPATLTMFQFAIADWTECSHSHMPRPMLVRIVQNGHLVWQQPGLADSSGVVD